MYKEIALVELVRFNVISINLVTFCIILDIISIRCIASQMPKCSRHIFVNINSLPHCVSPESTDRNWYQAHSECEYYGGELVSLETDEKMLQIEKELTTIAANVSTGIFVNAHKPLYSGNNQFAWKSGVTLNLTENPDAPEECVHLSKFVFRTIPCDNIPFIPLICQRTSYRIFSNIIQMKKVSQKQIKYINETCDYLIFVGNSINWYESKLFCETINSELIGIPNKYECRVIESLQSLARKMQIYLNIHPYLYIYSRNFSDSTYPKIKRTLFDEPICNVSTSLARKDGGCILIDPNGMIISSLYCDIKVDSLYSSTGLICKQCRPNPCQYFSSKYISEKLTAMSSFLLSTSSFIALGINKRERFCYSISIVLIPLITSIFQTKILKNTG